MSSEKNLSAESKFTLSLKEMVAMAIGFASLIGMYYTLQAQIQTAMELPKPEVNAIEFQYKDELVRSSILRIEEKTDVLNEDVQEVKDQLQKIDERLYQISKQK